VDDDNPEWTVQDAAAAKRFGELPATLQTKLRGRPHRAAVNALLTACPNSITAIA
jgi:hypothetical protein